MYRMNDEARWKEFIEKKNSGTPVEIDEGIWDWFLNCLPPIYMGETVALPDGRRVNSDFGAAEGAECVVAFWREGHRRFCCRTNKMNPYL